MQLLSLCEFEIILKQKMAQKDLNLVGDKESTGAGMSTVTPGEVVRAGADKLSDVLMALHFTHIIEPIAVPLLRVGIHLWIPHPMARYRGHAALGDQDAVGQLDIFNGHATHCCCKEIYVSRWSENDISI